MKVNLLAMMRKWDYGGMEVILEIMYNWELQGCSVWKGRDKAKMECVEGNCKGSYSAFAFSSITYYFHSFRFTYASVLACLCIM